MSERDVEGRIRTWFTTEVGEAEAPASLAAAVERIPSTVAAPSWTWRGLLPHSRPLALIALIALSLIALLGSIVIVGALLQARSPEPAAISNGWIAYATQPGHANDTRYDPPSDIYLVREGVEPRMLVGSGDEPARNLCPQFSPDGTRLAYGEGLGATGQPLERERRAIVILTLDRDGTITGPTIRLTVAGSGLVPCPSWSPDGERLAFPEGARLAVMRVDGTMTTIMDWDSLQVSFRQGGSFQWSPDGTMIAADQASGIWLAPVDGGEPRLIWPDNNTYGGLRSERFVSWSPEFIPARDRRG